MSARLPLIYIAGPLGAPSWLMVKRNIEAARDLGLLVAQHGAYPVIPHTNTGEFYGLLDEATLWVPGALELLRRCDALVLTANWETSAGARAEFAWARDARMPLYEYNEPGTPADLGVFISYVIGRQHDGYDYLTWPR